MAEGERVGLTADGRVVLGIGIVLGKVTGSKRMWLAKAMIGNGGGQYATRKSAVYGLIEGAGYRVVVGEDDHLRAVPLEPEGN
ncbi:MAG: hypothetical protein F8N36_14470 [Desulfovibrio sp.]|uniref:hypothetical protein n=1 Tax=Desulfovibrio sp. TaxID=885 RepID=UPI00135DFC88|nr:hypothetical protein [Desulfovibrio sp.]MTJ94043.1 hypothetical protein [Desulfovibrio sp.]